jgi:malonate decarboxylase gamma subunit
MTLKVMPRLVLLSELLSVENPEQPKNDDLLLAKQAIAQAFKKLMLSNRGLEQRLHGQNRQMSKRSVNYCVSNGYET